MIKAIPMEDWLRGCVYHDGRHGYVTLPTDKVHQIANYIQRTRRSGMDGLIDLEVVEADRKTENSSEKPNNWDEFFREPTAEERKAVADYIDSISVPTGVNIFDLMDEPQTDAYDSAKFSHNCIGMCENPKMHIAKAEDEPQTMLNDGTLVINVEDATKVGRVLVGDDKNRGGLYYPDYEDEPQTERSE